MPTDQEIKDALTKFVTVIENCGGVESDELGTPHPLGDYEWIDLGDAYMQACSALERDPMVMDADLSECEDFCEDKCEVCGEHLGYGFPAFHLGRCDEHSDSDLPE